MTDIVITEFMDEAAVDSMRERYAVHHDPELFGKPEELARVGRAARTYVTNERQWKHNIRQLIDFRDSLKSG